MRTLPAKFSTDYGTGKDLFYLIVVSTDSGNLYWHTSNKTFDLWPGSVAIHGGAAVTKTNIRLARQVDEEQIPLGTIQGSIALSMGGGVGQVANMTITLLNQDRYDTTLTALDLTNRQITIKKGFVDTVNGVGVNDMLMIKSFLIDEAYTYDYRSYTLSCVDAALQRYKEIPNITITKDDFPRAPSRSIDRVIPALYGDFETFNTEVAWTGSGGTLYNYHFGKYDAAPTIQTGEADEAWAVSELGPLNSVNKVLYITDNGVLGRMNNSAFSADPAADGFVKVTLGGWTRLTVDYFLVPKKQGTLNYKAGNSRWDQAVDDDPDTFVTGTSGDGVWGYCAGIVPFQGLIGTLQGLTSGGSSDKIKVFCLWEGAAPGTEYFKLLLYYPSNPDLTGTTGGVFTVLHTDYGDTVRHLETRSEAHADGHDCSQFNGVEVGIGGENAAGVQTIKVYHVCVQIRLMLLA